MQIKYEKPAEPKKRGRPAAGGVQKAEKASKYSIVG